MCTCGQLPLIPSDKEGDASLATGDQEERSWRSGLWELCEEIFIQKRPFLHVMIYVWHLRWLLYSLSSQDLDENITTIMFEC